MLTKQWKRNMNFSTWNVRSLYRSGLLTTATRVLARKKLDLVGVQKIRCYKVGMVGAGDVIFSMEKEMKSNNLEQFFEHRKIIPAVKRVEFHNDRIL